MNLCEITHNDQHILTNYFKKKVRGPILDIGCGEHASGVFIEIANKLGVTVDGLDCLDINPSKSNNIKNHIKCDVYQYDIPSHYNTITICDVTYIFECDNIRKVHELLDRIYCSCSNMIICVPYWVHEPDDTYTFRSSPNSPIRRLIRSLNFLNIREYFPKFKEILHQDQSQSSDGYGIYYYGEYG